MAGLAISALVEETTAYVVAKQRLWLTADGERLVPDGDPDAASLFVAPGHRIARADAERFGLLEHGAAPAPGGPPAEDPWKAATSRFATAPEKPARPKRRARGAKG